MKLLYHKNSNFIKKF